MNQQSKTKERRTKAKALYDYDWLIINELGKIFYANHEIKIIEYTFGSMSDSDSYNRFFGRTDRRMYKYLEKFVGLDKSAIYGSRSRSRWSKEPEAVIWPRYFTGYIWAIHQEIGLKFHMEEYYGPIDEVFEHYLNIIFYFGNYRKRFLFLCYLMAQCECLIYDLKKECTYAKKRKIGF